MSISKTSKPAIKGRQRRSPEAARENVLAAAQMILLESGPQNLKLAEVASTAGVVNATVLHHFKSIDGLQNALMARMVEQLVGRIVAITGVAGDPVRTADESLTALFDAFEDRGAARLAAWLELTGESRRLTVVRTAVRQVIDARMSLNAAIPPEDVEDFILACISIALGVGLFGATLSAQLDRPESRARDLALALVREQMARALAALVPDPNG
jgi:AcrR family transcriptional regulator